MLVKITQDKQIWQSLDGKSKVALLCKGGLIQFVSLETISNLPKSSSANICVAEYFRLEKNYNSLVKKGLWTKQK